MRAGWERDGSRMRARWDRIGMCGAMGVGVDMSVGMSVGEVEGLDLGLGLGVCMSVAMGAGAGARAWSRARAWEWEGVLSYRDSIGMLYGWARWVSWAPVRLQLAHELPHAGDGIDEREDHQPEALLVMAQQRAKIT